MTVDILIRGGRVFDGGGGPPVEADIAIEGDRIINVGRDISPPAARRVIDARGLAVCPGFGDIHGHSDYHLLLTPTAESAVLQGVTSEIGGNCGYAAAPIWGPWWEDRAKSYREVYGLDHEWHDVAAYFRRLMDVGISINFGLLIGHLLVAIHVFRPQQRKLGHRVTVALDAMIRMGDRLAGQDGRSLRLNHKAQDSRVILLEVGGAADKRAACADKIAKGVECSPQLPDDFRPGVQVMGTKVACQPKLVGSKGAALLDDTLRLAFDQLQVAAGYLSRPGARQLVHQDHFGPQGRHHAGSFHRIAPGHDRHERIALDAAHNGQPGAGVA